MSTSSSGTSSSTMAQPPAITPPPEDTSPTSSKSPGSPTTQPFTFTTANSNSSPSSLRRQTSSLSHFNISAQPQQQQPPPSAPFNQTVSSQVSLNDLYDLYNQVYRQIESVKKSKSDNESLLRDREEMARKYKEESDDFYQASLKYKVRNQLGFINYERL